MNSHKLKVKLMAAAGRRQVRQKLRTRDRKQKTRTRRSTGLQEDRKQRWCDYMDIMDAP